MSDCVFGSRILVQLLYFLRKEMRRSFDRRTVVQLIPRTAVINNVCFLLGKLRSDHVTERRPAHNTVHKENMCRNVNIIDKIREAFTAATIDSSIPNGNVLAAIRYQGFGRKPHIFGGNIIPRLRINKLY